MTDIRVTIDCDGEYCEPSCYVYFDEWHLSDCCQIYGDILQEEGRKRKRCQQCLDAEIK